MYEVNMKATGGYFDGDIKLSITLWLLAGGDALDLGVLFDITSDQCTIFCVWCTWMDYWMQYRRVDTYHDGVDICEYYPLDKDHQFY